MTGSAFHAMDVAHDEFMRRRGGGLEEGAGLIGGGPRLADFFNGVLGLKLPVSWL